MFQCAKHLPESVRATEYLRKFSKHMMQDRHVLDLTEKIVDQDVSCSECMKNVNLLLKKLGAPIMTNLYYRTIKALLERVSSVMVDGEAVEHLVALVKEALEVSVLFAVQVLAVKSSIRYVFMCQILTHTNLPQILPLEFIINSKAIDSRKPLDGHCYHIVLIRAELS